MQGSARGDPDMLTGLFGRTTVRRRLLPNLAASRRNVVVDAGGSEGPSVTVDWLSGACMLVRRDVLEQVEGFDERYFLYWEDADLCRRLRALGYQVRYVPGATAIHRVGHSSRDGRAAAVRAFHESAYLYYATHVAPHAATQTPARAPAAGAAMPAPVDVGRQALTRPGYPGAAHPSLIHPIHVRASQAPAIGNRRVCLTPVGSPGSRARTVGAVTCSRHVRLHRARGHVSGRCVPQRGRASGRHGAQ